MIVLHKLKFYLSVLLLMIKNLASKHARNNSVIVKIHIFHVNLLTTTTTTKQKHPTANTLSPSALQGPIVEKAIKVVYFSQTLLLSSSPSCWGVE